ncbi:MAG TPA: formylglycine-generating enzyme family protein [Candidatus Paceibacterota bacterium]|nr:formylglycine-generating enzyme family protein [Verrucomicrobiota bacterium]HOX04473.1 formylglycine-generating enzyme family protein [Verrucomicrobiota bacterium]HRZ47415.1 formylglycine-generating enzyme family protein [Candidatus Paceibacterota bacterium]HRZ92603.1 formylglycine-generating enzyme family protein [Candidatus Paceibacterota bacterium]
MAGRRVVIDLPGLPSGAKKLDLVLLIPGQFTMGSPASEPERSSNEEPQTEVTLSLPFFIGRYETTQGQWEAVMGNNPSNCKGDPDLPVEQVSWNDAQDFLRKLTARDRQAGRLPSGWEYRLPTEAQWEYACRAAGRLIDSPDDRNLDVGFRVVLVAVPGP